MVIFDIIIIVTSIMLPVMVVRNQVKKMREVEEKWQTLRFSTSKLLHDRALKESDYWQPKSAKQMTYSALTVGSVDNEYTEYVRDERGF